MIAQKTWIDLLGNDARNCSVDNQYIVRRLNPGEIIGRYVILHNCETDEMAKRVWNAWIEEIVTSIPDNWGA
jgi:hypothetical protein